MALSFQYRSPSASDRPPQRIAILPGAWNPPTIAHLAIARAALSWADEVVLTLPLSMPHKEFHGAPLQRRLELLCRLAAAEERLSAATTAGGLYLEIGNEAAETLGPQTQIGLVCGRDAAERIASWNYGRPGVFEEMLERFVLLVASRAGDYVPDSLHSHRILTLPLPPTFDDISSTEVRRRIVAGEPWRHLVPESIAADLQGGADDGRVWG